MFNLNVEPLCESNLQEQLEMLGGIVMQQPSMLQYSLLGHHFALCWLEPPRRLEDWLQHCADSALELRTLYIELPLDDADSRQVPQGIEHCRVASVEQAFDRHRASADRLEHDRVLISLALQDSPATLVCEYIV
jgi:hypothetical protein